MTAPPLVEAYDSGELSFETVDGARTRQYVVGTGDPLVLVHGGQPGSWYSLDSWSLNLAPLAESFRVYCFDKLGQGHTDNPPGPEQYTFESVFAHFRSTLRSLGLHETRSHFVGHSMGALLVAAVALECPDLVRTVTIVDSNTVAPDHPEYPWGVFYRDLERRLPPGPPSRASVRLEPEAQAFSRAQITETFVERLYEIATLPKSMVAAETMRGVRDDVWLPSLQEARRRVWRGLERAGFPAPTLVVWGWNDCSAPPGLAPHLFELIARKTEVAKLSLLNRAGHYVFRDQPYAFNELITAFCRSSGRLR